MAVAFDQSTTGTGSGTTWTITKPAHMTAGKITLLHIVVDGATTEPGYSGLSDWAQVGTAQVSQPTPDSTSFLFQQIADGSEPASWTLDWNAAESEDGSWAITTFSGNHATTAIGTTVNVDYRQGNANAATTVSAGPITPPEDNCMIFAGYSSDPAAGQAMTADSSPAATEAYDAINGTTSWIGGQYFLQGSAAAVTLDATMANSDQYSWHVVAIRPAAVAGGGPTTPSLLMAPYRAA